METNDKNNRKKSISRKVKLIKNNKSQKRAFKFKKKDKPKKKVATIAIRLRNIMLVFFLILVLLVVRLGYIQLVQGAELKEAMYDQLTTSRTISPKRGTIYDSTGKALARSVQVDTVSINATKIVVDGDEEATQELKEKVAKAFSEIFDLDYEETLEKVSSESSTSQTIASKVEGDLIDELEEWMEENGVYSGINIDEDTKRYYPYDDLASNLIGFCGTDNQGLEGLEAYWDDVLTGTSGVIVSSQDAVQDLIPDDDETYVAAENGSDITLTIDVNIQAIAEKYLEQACEEYDATEGGNVIIMDPNTGDILAMATYPDYNLNDPFTPTNIDEDDWEELSTSEQNETLQTIWNNRAVTSTYEPGSVFKIITAAAGLEEGLVDADTKNVFYCEGYETVADSKISCSNKSGHGYLSLREALEYSCNPAFIQLGQMIGSTSLYRYYNAFGFFDKTGIATTGERTGVWWDLDNVGDTELATMSFGQRFKITPLQMITAVAAIANDGVLMEPRIVKEVTNTDTGVVTTIEPTEVRQVVSEETAETLLDMLETVVEEGTGKNAQVEGYSIAGKTGTSEPDSSDEDGTYVASFVGIAPTESPEIVILVVLYGLSEDDTHSGSMVAAPVVSQILSEVLPYLEIPSDSTDTEDTETTTLSNVVNKTAAEAKKNLENAGFTCEISGDSSDIVIEQMPVAGTELEEGSIVLLYTEGNDTRVSQTVPDLKGMTASEAKSALKKKNLNIKTTGSRHSSKPKCNSRKLCRRRNCN